MLNELIRLLGRARTEGEADAPRESGDQERLPLCLAIDDDRDTAETLRHQIAGLG